MLREKAFRIGRIFKTHGVNGQLNVATDNRISEPDEWPDWVFLDIDVGLVPFRTRPKDMIWRDESHIIIALNDIEDQDKSRIFIGNDVWFPKDYKMDLLDSTSNIHPLIGYTVLDSDRGEIGKIVELMELPNNPLFKIVFNDREILVPAREEWIIEKDEAKEQIMMDLPDGLMDL